MHCKGTRCDSSTDICIGSWCTATIVEDKASNKTIERGCSTENPVSVNQDNCFTEVADSITTKRCACNDNNYCNSLADLSNKLNENLFAST